jgi:hypothetical protein
MKLKSIFLAFSIVHIMWIEKEDSIIFRKIWAEDPEKFSGCRSHRCKKTKKFQSLDHLHIPERKSGSNKSMLFTITLNGDVQCRRHTNLVGFASGQYVSNNNK